MITRATRSGKPNDSTPVRDAAQLETGAVGSNAYSAYPIRAQPSDTARFQRLQCGRVRMAETIANPGRHRRDQRAYGFQKGG